MSDAQTIAVYDASVQSYVDLTENDNANPSLDAFLGLLPAGAKILDLGCGTGAAAASMIARGFDVTATDASPEMVKCAVEQKKVPATVATFDALADDNQYDGIWANFSLLHATREAFPNHLRAVFTALRAGGILHLGMKLGISERRDTLGRHYAYYSRQELDQHLAACGFTIRSVQTGEAMGLAGDLEPWIVLLSHK